MFDAAALRLIPAPATRETLLVVPFRVKVAPPPPPLAPMIVIAGEVESCDKVMFEPATSANAEEDAVLTVPEVAPPKVDEMLVRTVPPPPPPAALIVTVPRPPTGESVMLGPATS
jgi:hypothetical protein